MTVTTDALIPAGFGFTREAVDPDLIMDDDLAEAHVEALNRVLRRRVKVKYDITWYPATNTGVRPVDTDKPSPISPDHPRQPDGMRRTATNVWQEYVDEKLFPFDASIEEIEEAIQ